MNENWKKAVSALLLAAVLCVLPGTMAWASDTGDGSGSTDVSAITPDAPVGEQSGGESGGTTPAGTESGGSDDSGSTSSGTEGTGNTGSDTTGGTITPDPPADQSGSESGPSTVIVVEQGDAMTPETEATPTTTPEATPTPTPTLTPTATPAPTPALPIVTKHPTDETVDVGGECWFIANYSNALYAAWHFVSPDGKTDYRYDDQAIPTAFPGLKIENGMYSNLHLSSIPAEMNGWGAYCEYRNNNGSTKTSAAVVHVNGAPDPTPTPSPSATPTATPSPTPTPAATATPAPSPETTPGPEEAPTPEGSGEPAAALNRGGKIFLLFGAAALAVGAVAIGTILLVAKRGAEKEAYTYRSKSKLRK